MTMMIITIITMFSEWQNCCCACIDALDFFAQFDSYHLICSNKQLITGSMKFADDSAAGGNKT